MKSLLKEIVILKLGNDAVQMKFEGVRVLHNTVRIYSAIGFRLIVHFNDEFRVTVWMQ
jgi:hypothetical protein